MDTSTDLSISDLITIRKALFAYMEHLAPSASHVREIADWRDKISDAEHKITKIILSTNKT